MATCAELSKEMADLSAKIKLYQTQITAALSHGNYTLADDLSKGLAIAQSELEADRAQWLSQGCAIPLPHPIVTTIRILIVLDGDASFGPTDKDDAFFGLSTVIRALTTPQKGLIFQISRAHRDVDPQDFSGFPATDQTIFRTDYTTFKFDEFDAEGGLRASFDEIWMFGVNFGAPGLAQSELKAIATFMDAGGGVFAVGDHEDLGLEMCGEVLRVRNMRKWYLSSPPAGLSVAPPALGPGRHDTIQSLDGGVSFHFDNQSDDTPQPLKLTLFSGLPHPVLSGPSGPISQFPDHMHEGEVVVPTVTTDSPTYNGTAFEEYRWRTLVFKGHHFKYQPLPQVIAKGTVIGGHTTSSDEGVHPSDTSKTSGTYDFGVVGVYDGHLVNVGRVAVDSTWHHFFDINLIGDPAAASAGRTLETEGFTTVKGTPVLNNMRAYYHNLVMWLAPAAIKTSMLASILYHVRFRQPLNELVSPRERSAAELLEIGEVARSALSASLGESMALDLVHGWLSSVPAAAHLALRPFEPDGGTTASTMARIAAAALGGAVLALGKALPKQRRVLPQELTETVERGLHHGLGVLAAQLKAEAHALAELAQGLGTTAESRAQR